MFPGQWECHESIDGVKAVAVSEKCAKAQGNWNRNMTEWGREERVLRSMYFCVKGLKKGKPKISSKISQGDTSAFLPLQVFFSLPIFWSKFSQIHNLVSEWGVVGEYAFRDSFSSYQWFIRLFPRTVSISSSADRQRTARRKESIIKSYRDVKIKNVNQTKYVSPFPTLYLYSGFPPFFNPGFFGNISAF